MYIVKSGMSYVLNAKTGEMIGINSDNESQRLGCAMQAERYSFEEAKAVVASMESRGLSAEILELKVGSVPLVNVSVPASKVKELQQLLKIEHEHREGQNECAICDQPLIDAAIDEIVRLKEIQRKLNEAARHIIRRMANDNTFECVMHGTQAYWTIISAYSFSLGKDLDELKAPPSMMRAEQILLWLNNKEEEA